MTTINRLQFIRLSRKVEDTTSGENQDVETGISVLLRNPFPFVSL